LFVTDFIQKTFVMDTGERYCLLIDSQSDLPLFYPNLYVATQVRNKSLSYSAMGAALSGISVLLRFMDNRNENIEKRFLERKFFNDSELDAIRDFCQLRFQLTPSEKSSASSLSVSKKFNKKVCSETEYSRLTVIAQYIHWLAGQIATSDQDRTIMLQIKKMEIGLKARRPVKKGRNVHTEEKGLTEFQLGLLFELFRPESAFNPFKDPFVRSRNRLIFLLLYHLGLRGGELLNIRIRDIDFTKNQLVITRRADEKDDSRKYQPLVKTLDRRLPIKETLVQELHYYIIKERKKIPSSNKNDFLFITHKSGPTQGQPLSKSGYKKVIEIVRSTSPSLFNLTGHQLRHTWNEAFSKHMDSMNESPNQEQQEKMRSYLMGWRENSGTASIYNKRFIRSKANEASLKLQDGLIRLPKGVSNE